MSGKISHKNLLAIYFVVIEMLGDLVWLVQLADSLIMDYGQMMANKKLYEVKDPVIEKNLKIKQNNKRNHNETVRIETESILKIDNMSFKYPKADKWIFKDFNLDIEVGKTVCIVGSIGSGKTTLVKLILGKLKPTQGKIYLNGYDYDSMTQKTINEQYGYMGQMPVLFNRTIYENITYGQKNPAKPSEIWDLLKKFNLVKEFSELELGLKTVVGKNGSKLSGGQRQIVWFLRIYLKNPPIMILDEPTASLDTDKKTSMMKILDTIFKDKTVIIISHDDFVIKRVEKVIKLKADK